MRWWQSDSLKFKMVPCWASRYQETKAELPLSVNMASLLPIDGPRLRELHLFKAPFRSHSLFIFYFMDRRIQRKRFNFEHIAFLKSDLFKKQNTRNS